MKFWKGIIFILAAQIFMFASCSKESIHGDGFDHTTSANQGTSVRVPISEKRHVLVLYSAGYNSLSDYLQEDIKDLKNGWIPGSSRSSNILLVYSHFTTKKNSYSSPNSPTLTRLSTDMNGNLICDTLLRYPAETYSATAEQLQTVMEYVRKTFPADSYGMIFSSHATGYLPSGYYTNPYSYVFNEKDGMMYRGGRRSFRTHPVPYIEPEHDPSLPAVKSIGQDQVGTYGNYQSYEIEIDDFAKALPMKMEYILFDACLMGGVEVAYELRNKCRYVAFSQTEVLAEGFNYTTIASHLIGSETPDPQAVCEDYYHQYDIQTGIYHSATISMVDCTRMEPLAEVCRELFDRYGMAIMTLNPESKDVQQYFRSKYHWFYDLKDIIAKAGATEEELQRVQNALDQCICYKAATPKFMDSFYIKTYSGLSMYLQSQGTNELDKYYRTLEWDKATSLVK